jgi:hypothetical protein
LLYIAGTQLLVNNAVPPSALGSVNGFALALTALIRSVTPAAMTSLFALGVERNVLHRYLAWVVLAILSVGCFIVSGFAPKDDKKTRTVNRRIEGSQDVEEA